MSEPFHYSTYTNPYAASIADLMLEQGRIRAQGAAANGAIWGRAIEGIGNAVAGVAGAVAQSHDPRVQIEKAQLAEIQQRQAAAKKFDALVAGDQLHPGDQGPHQESFLTSEGLFDIPKLNAAFGAQGAAHFAPEFLAKAEAINDSVLKARQLQHETAKQHTIALGHVAHGALGLMTFGAPADVALDSAAAPALATELVSQQEYDKAKAAIMAMPPEQQKAALTRFMNAAAAVAPTKTHGKDTTETDIFGRVIASNVVPDKAEKATFGLQMPDGTVKNVEGTFLPSANGGKGAYSYLGEDVSAHVVKPTEQTPHSLDEQLLEAVTKGDHARAKQITDTMRAAAAAKNDPSITAATERQIAAINAQVAQQGRAQTFQEAERGRTVLDANDKTFDTAKAIAEELRATVAAAKAGNKFAASQQSLQATMATIRSQGLNRINTTEIGVSESAGGLFDRILGRLGKLAEGQPIPADIQKDMLEYADILEKAAFKRYSDTFDTTIQRYQGLDKEKKKPGPSLPAPSAMPPGVASRLKGG